MSGFVTMSTYRTLLYLAPTISLGSHQNIYLLAHVQMLCYLLTYLLKCEPFASIDGVKCAQHRMQLCSE